jgi:tetratricopeptide (TPR) repeat protein
LYRTVQFGLALPHTQPAAAALVLAAFSFVFARGYWQEWLPVMEKAASVASLAQMGSRFWLLTRLGQLRRLNRKLAGALSAHRQALDVAAETGEPFLLAVAHYNLGRALRDARLYAEAETQLQTSAQLLEQMERDDAEGLAASVNNALGRLAHDRGQLADAQEFLERAVAIRREQGTPVPLADDLHDLGNLFRASGAYEPALACYEEALDLLQGTGHRLNRAQIHFSRGVLHFSRREYALAEAVFREIDLPFLRETGNLHLQAMILVSLGNALLYQRRYGQAADMLRGGVVLWEQLEDDLELANAIGSLGEALAGLGEKEKAGLMFDEALALLAHYPDSAKAGRLRALFTAEREKVAGQAEA